MATTYIPVLILLFLSSFCRSDDHLSRARSLSPGETLISDGGAFALGFFSLANSNNNLYIGIWYRNIPERTVVWVANRDSPVITPSSAKLVITNSSALALLDSDGRFLWTNNVASTDGAGAVAVLLSSGNFVLCSSIGTEIWQSFDHPTDTILPTMRLLISYKDRVTSLAAWKGPDDPSTGEFSCGVDPSSDLQLFIWRGSQPYYRTTVLSGISVSDDTSRSNTNFIMYETVVNTRDIFYFNYTVSDGAPYTRVLLDHTGRLRSNDTLSWTLISESPGNCSLYASCGPFSYCDNTVAAPTCRCPEGFEPLDSLNFSRRCQRKETLKCGNEYHFVTLPNVKLPDKFLHVGNRGFDQCAAECNRDCSCTAYAFANLSSSGTMGSTSRCLVWTGDLIDMGKAALAGQSFYLRLAKSSPAQKKRNLTMILLLIIPSLVLLTFIGLFWAHKYNGKRRKKEAQKITMIEYLDSMDEAGEKNIEFPFINFNDIIVATANFSDSNMLGKGGFGNVYKGKLEGGKEAAVKRLRNGSGQGTEEFRNEVVLIAKLQHKNLVKLLGCCIHEDEKLLVYEYLPNKSLDSFLFDSARKKMLTWPTRFKIIQGVARGIMYLHRDSRLRIIHRDLKASNILLDKEMNPKISDFGMARIFSGDQLQANTNKVVGTYDYMSPEYAMEGAFFVKSDTYSFGVLLLEIVSGLRISSTHIIMDFPVLISYAWNSWKDGNIDKLVDSSIMESCCLEDASRCIHIRLLCVQDSPSCRLLMSAVVSMLEIETMQLPVPMQPVYFARRDVEPRRASDDRVLSANDITLTALEGR